MRLTILLAALLAAAPARQEPLEVHRFTLTAPAEVVAMIMASCARCDWGASDREAVVLELRVDGEYSQHSCAD